MAQKAPEKVQAIIDKNKKIDILVAFKAAYPDAIISFKTPENIIEIVEELLDPTKEELKAEQEAAAKAEKFIQERKAKERAALEAKHEAELKALDES